jgi:transcriptional regulator with XRE-family HTH domain
MPGIRRGAVEVEAARRWAARRAKLGADIKAVRLRRRWSQADMGRRARLGRGVIARLEQGVGRFDLEVLERLAIVMGVPLNVSLGRDPREDVADAGHLAMQELLLRLGRRTGFDRQFEVATRPSEPWRSADVVLGSDARRTFIHQECWNTFGDLGAAARSSTRKLAELEQLAVAKWGAEGRAALVWVVRDTARNRALVARYPEVFATRFPGSSRRWVEALTQGGPIPTEPGLVWCDPRRGELRAWRRAALAERANAVRRTPSSGSGRPARP